MKTYISIWDKKATLANSKKEAAKKMGISESKVHISGLHIGYLVGYETI